MSWRGRFSSFTLSGDDKLEISKVLSAAKLASKYGDVRYTGFYDPRTFKIVTDELEKADISYKAFGGYDSAERLMLCIGADECEWFPVSAVVIKTVEAKYRHDNVTHRDALGSVLGLGITRDTVGDIFSCDNGYVVICRQDMAEYICCNLHRVGRQNVKCTAIDVSGIIPPEREYIYKNGTVASKRLDAVVAFVTGKNRAAAAEIIASGLVRINYFPVNSQTFSVADGDVISIKGFGKANILFSGESRKGRIFITAEKYN